MPKQQQPVLVFRTSVGSHAEVERLRPALDAIIDTRGRWNFDLEDRDRVLRFETESSTPSAVMQLMHQHGHECSELE